MLTSLCSCQSVIISSNTKYSINITQRRSMTGKFDLIYFLEKVVLVVDYFMCLNKHRAKVKMVSDILCIWKRKKGILIDEGHEIYGEIKDALNFDLEITIQLHYQNFMLFSARILSLLLSSLLIHWDVFAALAFAGESRFGLISIEITVTTTPFIVRTGFHFYTILSWGF